MFQKPQLAGWFPVLFLFLMAISGQTRIQLKPGAPAMTIEGEVERNKETFYVLQAKAGLKFSGRLATKAERPVSPWRMQRARAFPKNSSTSILI